jgi:hypothetical protein
MNGHKVWMDAMHMCIIRYMDFFVEIKEDKRMHIL